MEVQQYMSFVKRKRSIDDINGNHFSDIKRRQITALPIRSPPSIRPSISVTPAFAAFTKSTAQLPTPVSTSEDEPYSSDRLWMQRSRSANFPSSSTPAFAIPPRNDSNDDVNMSFSSSPTPSLKAGRARSNDLMSPQRYLGINNPASPGDAISRERVPTPITSTFAATDYVSRPTPSLRTVLSPMMDEEIWSKNGGLLSPMEEAEADCRMTVDDTNEGMTGMRSSDEGPATTSGMEEVNTISDGGWLNGVNDCDPRQSTQRPRLGLVNIGPDIHDHNSRSARLHMGFRADCDKCLQRVPGHYSHIIWS